MGREGGFLCICGCVAASWLAEGLGRGGEAGEESGEESGGGGEAVVCYFKHGVYVYVEDGAAERKLYNLYMFLQGVS